MLLSDNLNLYSHLLPIGGNMEVGFPRREIIYAPDNDVAILRGPPIATHHPADYNVLEYRCWNGIGNETFNKGVAGLYNITRGEWITDYIDDIKDGVLLDLNFNSQVEKGHKLVIYYYALPHTDGGYGYCNIPGDQLWPETYTIIQRVYNDSVTFDLMSNWSTDAGRKEHRFFTDFLKQVVSTPTEKSWVQILDKTTWTKADSNYGMPIQITEIVIDIRIADGSWALPDILKFKILIDGTNITDDFGISTEHALRVTAADWDHTNFSSTDEDHAGRIFSYKTEKNPLTHRVTMNYLYPAKNVMRVIIDIGKVEVLDNITIQMYWDNDFIISFHGKTPESDWDIYDVTTYVRAHAVDTNTI